MLRASRYNVAMALTRGVCVRNRHFEASVVFEPTTHRFMAGMGGDHKGRPYGSESETTCCACMDRNSIRHWWISGSNPHVGSATITQHVVIEPHRIRHGWPSRIAPSNDVEGRPLWSPPVSVILPCVVGTTNPTGFASDIANLKTSWSLPVSETSQCVIGSKTTPDSKCVCCLHCPCI